jgi:threonine synthase
VLSTAHPAKFSEAVTKALVDKPDKSHRDFDFERDVLPEEFRGLLEKEKRVIDVERPDVEEVKGVIERFAQSDNGVASGPPSV